MKEIDTLVSESNKIDCLNIAVQVTAAWGNCGDPKMSPGAVLQDVYKNLTDLLKKARKEE